ncbi:MAG: hypothetical protein ACFE8L_13985 [Candidatus Hodarchaeota archaeon]
MSQANMDKNVQDFLKKIKEKLPEWLKDKKGELRDVLSEIEEHIWDKAEELSDIGTPTESSVRLALAHMGTPESIAKEYKRRGTPKVYITEELWSLYTKVLGILCAIVFMVNMIFMIINIVTGNFQLDLVEILLEFTGVFTIVTLIFVGLSMEGYLPEDFKTQEERRREEIAERKGWPISPKTGKPLKPFIQPTGNIVGGIIEMAIGLIFIIQPTTEFTHKIDPEFLALMRIFGILIITEGSLYLIRGIIGNQQITKHQIILSIKMLLSIMNIPLFVILLKRPELVPFVPFKDYIISWFFGFVIFFVIIDIISDIYKAATLEKYRDINF